VEIFQRKKIMNIGSAWKTYKAKKEKRLEVYEVVDDSGAEKTCEAARTEKGQTKEAMEKINETGSSLKDR
jgi:DNA-directed RNA polymerase subunit N (RpoN/RPB10)